MHLGDHGIEERVAGPGLQFILTGAGGHVVLARHQRPQLSIFHVGAVEEIGFGRSGISTVTVRVERLLRGHRATRTPAYRGEKRSLPPGIAAELPLAPKTTAPKHR